MLSLEDEIERISLNFGVKKTNIINWARSAKERGRYSYRCGSMKSNKDIDFSKIQIFVQTQTQQILDGHSHSVERGYNQLH